jgi:Coenzyme PQQ synthesis protein D (PqqD)
LVTQDWNGETLVYDLETHRAHCLNVTAAFVWRQCDGRRSVAQIAKRVGARFGQPADRELVRLALRRLKKARLLKPSKPSGPARGLTRREATRKLGRLSALSVIIPTVTSILAPTPAAAASCLQIAKGQPCLATQCGQPCGKCSGKPGGSACLNFGGGLYECGKGGTCP